MEGNRAAPVVKINGMVKMYEEKQLATRRAGRGRTAALADMAGARIQEKTP